MNSINQVESESSHEIVTKRVLNAKRELVFSAFSDPNHLANWWGPKGFKNTFHEFNFIPGGKWSFIMHGPDGVDYQNESEFIMITIPEQIVIKHISKPHFEMTITLTENEGKTEIKWRMLFETSKECERVKKIVVEANEQNLDRLENELLLMK